MGARPERTPIASLSPVSRCLHSATVPGATNFPPRYVEPLLNRLLKKSPLQLFDCLNPPIFLCLYLVVFILQTGTN